MSAIDIKSEDDEQVVTPTTAPEAPAAESHDTEPQAEQAAAPAAPAATPVSKPVTGGGNHRSFGHLIAETILGLLVVGLALWAWTVAADRNNLQKQLDAVNANPQALVQKQTDELIAKVGGLMNLPSGETPTVANVTDAAKAKQQSNFFANAQNGDKVLMYVKAGEAILYRPSTNKIILVAPLTFNNSSTSTTAAPATTSTTTPKR
jgi:hypothetical protein